MFGINSSRLDSVETSEAAEVFGYLFKENWGHFQRDS